MNFNLADRLCVVVGGGSVGRRKAAALLAAGARVCLIDPDPGTGVVGCEVRRRPYRAGDLEGAVLAVAATDDRAVNAAVAAEARRLHIPVNIVDDPAAGDFFLPAVLRRGEITIAVATGGESPALSAVLRDLLAETVGPEWQTVAAIAAALRQKRLTLSNANAYDQQVLRRLLEHGLPALVAAGDVAAIDGLLSEHVEAGMTLAALGIPLLKGLP